MNSTVFFGFYAIVLSSGDNHFPSRHNDLQPIVYDFKICLLITYVSVGEIIIRFSGALFVSKQEYYSIHRIDAALSPVLQGINDNFMHKGY
ncbi:hypothetical protein ACQYBH_002508 [Salmonella enterica]|nr:hypothetical protein [Salmonella enterica]